MKRLRHSEINLSIQDHEASIKCRARIWTQTCQTPKLEHLATVTTSATVRPWSFHKKVGPEIPDSRTPSVPFPASSPHWFWKRLNNTFSWVTKSSKLSLARILQIKHFRHDSKYICLPTVLPGAMLCTLWIYNIYEYIHRHTQYYLLSNPKNNLLISNYASFAEKRVRAQRH